MILSMTLDSVDIDLRTSVLGSISENVYLQYLTALHCLVYFYRYILVTQVQFDEGMFVTDHTALI